MGDNWHGAPCAKNVGAFHHQKSVDQSVLVDAEKGEQEFGSRSRRTKRSLSSTTGTCALKVY